MCSGTSARHALPLAHACARDCVHPAAAVDDSIATCPSFVPRRGILSLFQSSVLNVPWNSLAFESSVLQEPGQTVLFPTESTSPVFTCSDQHDERLCMPQGRPFQPPHASAPHRHASLALALPARLFKSTCTEFHLCSIHFLRIRATTTVPQARTQPPLAERCLCEARPLQQQAAVSEAPHHTFPTFNVHMHDQLQLM